MVFWIVEMAASDSPASILSDGDPNALGFPRCASSVSGPSGYGGNVNRNRQD